MMIQSECGSVAEPPKVCGRSRGQAEKGKRASEWTRESANESQTQQKVEELCVRAMAMEVKASDLFKMAFINDDVSRETGAQLRATKQGMG